KAIIEEVKNFNLSTTQARVKAMVSKIQQSAEKQNVALLSGLLDVRIHDLRRTFASYQAMTGSSLQIIGKSLGHKSQQATQIYARLNLDPVRSSVEKAVDTMFSY
ncbi:MAG TPA: tyrosine-type recombinase/integrase, partial [Catalimonadaceae bacterium]|nr:tyrosine-type recombinase/integrase [Catalimonadaceae bacterium]